MYFRIVPLWAGFMLGLHLTQATAATSTGENLARDSKCLACHQVESRRVGPPFAAIAERFAGQPGAAQYLAGVIQRGGRGQWGAIPMPAQPHVNEAQAAALAQWILSLSSTEKP
jgi:cytochrome c